MRSLKGTLLKQLDQRLRPFGKLMDVSVPEKGWIRNIRTSLNITMEQLGRQLNVSRQGVNRMENAEVDGTLTLNSMKKIGNALDMKFVYGFTPKSGSVQKLVDEKARQLATRIVHRTHRTMDLENQALEEKKVKEAIAELTLEFKRELPKILWD